MSPFGKSVLEKHGWKTGKGLGKCEDGITEPLRAKMKSKNTGVGYDMSAQYKDHWWDRTFNDAASSIIIGQNEDGIRLHVKPALKVIHRRQQLYGNFHKGATLHDGQTTPTIIEPTPDDPSTDVTKTTGRLLDNKMLDLCNGRTAHKGARHGIKSEGKLNRIAEQEAEFMRKWSTNATRPASKEGDKCVTTKLRGKLPAYEIDRLKKNSDGCTVSPAAEQNDDEVVDNDQVVDNDEIVDNDQVGRRKRKKDKRKNRASKTMKRDENDAAGDYCVRHECS